MLHPYKNNLPAPVYGNIFGNKNAVFQNNFKFLNIFGRNKSTHHCFRGFGIYYFWVNPVLQNAIQSEKMSLWDIFCKGFENMDFI